MNALAILLFAAQVLGTQPAYLPNVAPKVPNEAAIGTRIFLPELDDDWVPQGLAVEGAHVLVAAYKPTPDIKSSKGPCRVWRIERATGRVAGQFDVPLDNCNSHAGGLAWLGEGRLMLADTVMLSVIDYPKALAAGTAAGAIRTVKTQGGLRGSFAASRGAQAWTGMWSKEADKSKMYRLPDGFWDDTARTPDESVAAEVIPVPLEAQGAAFDRDGNLWTTSSRSNQMSKLFKLDAKGRVLAEYDMPMGLEGIAFAPDGKLWALSESGTKKYLRWGPEFHFPFAFEVDVSRLR